MNRSERYRSRNSLSAKRKSSRSRALPLVALVVLLIVLLCNPLVSVKDLALKIPVLAPYIAQDVSLENAELSEGNEDLEMAEDASKTIVINSSIEESNTVVMSSEDAINSSGAISGADGASSSDAGVSSYGGVVLSGEAISGSANGAGGGGSVSIGSSDVIVVGGELGSSGWSSADSSGLVARSGSNVVVVDDGAAVSEGGSGAAGSNSSRPMPGHIFERSGEGTLPQLTVVAPEDQDAYVKLKNVETGETMLSFYVRAGYTVKACVPVGYCDFFYVLGEGSDWLGTERAFGDNGVYAKADRSLNFTNPLNNYTYRFNVEDGNISPVTISKAIF